jgi:predicted RNA binding protein YcfA (HicA-like mRNA interferase family)
MRRLRELGYSEVRASGSHVRFVSSCGRCHTTVPDHGGQDLKRGTLHGIEKDMEPCLESKWLVPRS